MPKLTLHRWNVLKRLEYPAEILQLFTQDKDKAKIHVMSMFEFSFASTFFFSHKLKFRTWREQSSTEVAIFTHSCREAHRLDVCQSNQQRKKLHN